MFKLEKNIQKYFYNNLEMIEVKLKLYRSIQVTLNVLILLCAFVTTTLTTFILSKVFFSGFPSWFFFATTGVTAFGTLSTTLLNFFVVREKLKEYRRNKNYLLSEKVDYDNQISKKYKGADREYNFFTEVAAILGSKAAKEVKHG